MVDKLIIGSANFGLKYGIANNRKLSTKDIVDILEYAKQVNVWGVDTAKGYQDAEKIIGDFFKKSGNKCFKIITKLPHKNYTSVQGVRDEVIGSLTRLNIDCMDFLLLHSFKTYQGHKNVIMQAFAKLAEEGLIRHWGVSVYHTQEADELISDGFNNFAIEFPLNIFDRRFLKNDFLEKLKQKECFLFARSVFLQGLFFLKHGNLTGRFSKARQNIDKLNMLAKDFHTDVSCIAFLFVAAKPYIDGIIVGVDSRKQLENNIGYIKQLKTYQQAEPFLDGLEMHDSDILLPYMWGKEYAQN